MERWSHDWQPPLWRQMPRGRDPISGAIALQALLGSSALFTTEAAVLGLGFLGAAGSFAAQAALSIGISMAATSLLARGSAGSSAVNSPESRYNTRQSIPPKRTIFGKEVYCGGALVFEKVKPPYLYQMYMICDGEIDGVDGIYIGTNKLLFPSIVPNTILTPLAQDGQPNYKDRLKVSIRLGKEDQAICPLIAQDFPDEDTNFRQRGIATVTLRYDFGADQEEYTSLWGNNPYPLFSCVARGIRVCDPRVSGSSYTDPATWVSSNNASVVQAHYAVAPYGGRLNPASIPVDRVKSAADYDDGLFTAKNGDNLRKHTIDGLVTRDQSPADILSGMLSANRGKFIQAGGQAWPTSSIPLKPVLTITDDMLSAGIDYSAGKDRRDLINILRTRFVAKEVIYAQEDGPEIRDNDLIAQDGEPLPGTLNTNFSLDHRRVQRLGNLYFKTQRLEEIMSCSIRIEALAMANDELCGNAIRFQSELFPQANGIYFCDEVAFEAATFSSLQLALSEYDAEIENSYNAATQEQEFTPSNNQD